MAKQKKDFGTIVSLIGWFLGVATAMRKIVNRQGVPFEAFDRLGTEAGEATLEKIVALVHAEWLAEQPKPQGGSKNLILVPNLSSAELLAEFEKKVKPTYLNQSYRQQDFVAGERGQTFEVATWAPGHDVSSEQVKSHFESQGFKGNSAAFIAWIMQHNPRGYHASIPEQDRLLRGGRGYLCAPCFDRDGARRALDLYDVGVDWHDYWVFVAFRELHA